MDSWRSSRGSSSHLRARGFARGRRAGRRGGGGRPGAARVVGEGVVEDGAVVVERVPEVGEIVLLGGGAPVVAAPAPRREARGEVVEIPGVHRGRERVVLRRRDGRTSVGWGVGGITGTTVGAGQGTTGAGEHSHTLSRLFVVRRLPICDSNMQLSGPESGLA